MDANLNSVSIFAEDFVNCWGIGSVEYNEKILIYMIDLLDAQIIEATMIPPIIEKAAEYADYLINQITKCNNELINFKLIDKATTNETKMTKQNTQYRQILLLIPRFFFKALKRYPNEALMFFSQGYLERILSYLTKEESLEFAIEVDTYFICRLNNVDFGMRTVQYLFGVFIRYYNQIAITTSKCLAKLYLHIDLPIEYVSQLVEAYHTVFKKDYTSYPEYSDLAIGTFAVLITKYQEQMKEFPPLMSIVIKAEEEEEESGLTLENLYDCDVKTFIEALPIWDCCTFNDCIFNLLASLIENSNKFIMTPYEFCRCWFNLIQKIDYHPFWSMDVNERFKNIIREISSNPRFSELFELVYSYFN